MNDEKQEVTSEVSTEPVVETNTNPVESEVKKEEPKIENISGKKGKGGNKLPLVIGIIAIILIAAAAGLFYYMQVLNNPQQVFKTLIEETKEKVLSVEDVNMDEIQSIKAGIELDVELDLIDGILDKEVIGLINDLELALNVEANVKDEEFISNIDVKKGKDQLVKVAAALKDDKVYMDLGDLFDKVIYVESEEKVEFNLETDSLTDDEKKLVIAVLDAVNNSLEKEYFIQEKVDGAKKNTLVINDANAKGIVKSVCNTLKDDEEFIKIAAELSEVEASKLKTSLEEVVKNIDEETLVEEGSEIYLSIYTKGIISEVSKVEVAMKDGEEVTLSVILDIVSDEEIAYTLESNGQKITGKLIVKGDEKSADITFTLKFGDYIDAKVDLGITAEISKDAKVEIPEYKDAVSVDDLTEADATTLKNNCEKNEALKDVIDLISEMMPKSPILPEDDYDFDYDYDYDYDDEDEDEDTSKTDEKDDDKKDTNKKDDSYNVIKYNSEKISIKYDVPEDYVYDDEYSTDTIKFYDYEKSRDEEIDVTVEFCFLGEEDFLEDAKDDYDYYSESDTYKNVKMSQVKEVKVGKNTFKCITLSLETSYTNYDILYAVYKIDDEYAFGITAEADGMKIPSDFLQSFGNITVSK